MTFSENIAPIEVFPAAARAGDGTSSVIDRNDYGRSSTWMFLLSCGEFSGQNPSMTITIEHAEDADEGPWESVAGGHFAQISESGFAEKTYTNLKRFLRVVISETGGTPNFTFCLLALAGDPLEAPI